MSNNGGGGGGGEKASNLIVGLSIPQSQGTDIMPMMILYHFGLFFIRCLEIIVISCPIFWYRKNYPSDCMDQNNT